MSYLVVARCARTVAQNVADARTWADRHAAEVADLYGDCICSPGHCRDGMEGLQAVCAWCAHQPPGRECSATAA